MNKKLLKSKMVLFGDSIITLATILKVSRPRLSAKINTWNGAEFNQSEIEAIKIRYELTPDEVIQIFFNESVI